MNKNGFSNLVPLGIWVSHPPWTPDPIPPFRLRCAVKQLLQLRPLLSPPAAASASPFVPPQGPRAAAGRKPGCESAGSGLGPL